MINLKALTEKRELLLDQMKAMQFGAEMERRCLTSNENELFNYMEKEVRDIDNTLNNHDKAFKRGKTSSHATGEYRNAEEQLNAELRGIDGTGTASAGVTIPTVISEDIVKNIAEISDVINHCKSIYMNGKYKQIKRNGSNNVAWTKEFAEVLKSKATYDAIEIDQYKISGLDTVSLEIFNGSEFNITEEVKNNLIEDLAEKVEYSIFYGNGQDEPTGLLHGTELTETILSADLIIDMVTSLKAKYSKGAKFYLSRPMLSKIRKLKDNEGRYIFSTKDNNILGYEYNVTESLENEIVFGNFKLGYMLNINNGMTVNVLKEKYIDFGAIGVILHSFIGGKPIDEKAFTTYKIIEPVAATTRLKKVA